MNTLNTTTAPLISSSDDFRRLVANIASGILHCDNRGDCTLQRVGMEKILAAAKEEIVDNEGCKDIRFAKDILILSEMCLGLQYPNPCPPSQWSADPAERLAIIDRLALLSRLTGMHGLLNLESDESIQGAFNLLNSIWPLLVSVDRDSADLVFIRIVLANLAGKPLPFKETWKTVAQAIRACFPNSDD